MQQTIDDPASTEVKQLSNNLQRRFDEQHRRARRSMGSDEDDGSHASKVPGPLPAAPKFRTIFDLPMPAAGGDATPAAGAVQDGGGTTPTETVFAPSAPPAAPPPAAAPPEMTQPATDASDRNYWKYAAGVLALAGGVATAALILQKVKEGNLKEAVAELEKAKAETYTRGYNAG